MSVSNKEKGSSITRVLEIIEAVSKAERPMSPADLAYQLDIPKPSIHRLLSQLEAENFLQLNMRGLVVPGNRMQGIALGVLYNNRFKAERQAILTKLTALTGETCGISIPNGSEMIYYDRVQNASPLQVHLPIGSHTPICATASGKLYLSSLPKSRCQRIVQNLPLQQYARNTCTDVQRLSAEISNIRNTGIATDNEEFVDGMVAVAVPITGGDGKLFACLFSHAPVIRKSLQQLLEFTPLLQQTAVDLGELLNNEESERDESS